MEGNSQKNKRGSVAITVIMLMTGLLILITAYIHASKTLAVRGCTREMGLMWCESVLGEYDLNLQRRYGIFGFYGTVDEIGEKIDRYAMCSFRGKKYVDYHINVMTRTVASETYTQDAANKESRREIKMFDSSV